MTLRDVIVVAFALLENLAFAGEVVDLTFPAAPDAQDYPAVASQNCEHTTNAFYCVQYLQNHDGDTITVRVHHVHPLLGERIPVRIDGIDAPEMYSPDICERVAAKRAQVLVSTRLRNAQRVDLVSLQRDKYFRILADVRADGESLAGILLMNGLAYPYDGGTKKKVNWCAVGNRVIE